MSSTSRAFSIVHLSSPSATEKGLARDALVGLSSTPKQLAPKYFYDGRGSELFEEITRLPEYYPTRAETEILERCADAVCEAVRPEEMVELGSGSSRKTELLIEAMQRTGGQRYVAFDVSEDALCEAAERLCDRHPELDVEVVVGDFDGELNGIPRKGRRLVLLLGSTLGNFARDERVEFLRRVRTMLAPEDRFLLGVDLVKGRKALEAAYDDSAGVTAEFNKNVLHVLNRELDGDLPVEDFEHVAEWDEDRALVDIRLRAKRPVDARLAAIDLDVHFDEGEELHTEISSKFTRARVGEELAAAGLELDAWHTDEDERFALVLARRAG